MRVSRWDTGMVRDEKGRFIKGQTGNPNGRPKKEREIIYYRILEMAVTKDDWETICAKAVNDAKRGDAVARKWISDYLIGPPVQRQEVTGADGGPIYVVNWDADADNSD